MPDAPARFYRDRWTRECIHKRRLSRATDRPDDKVRRRGQAWQAIRNAREWQGRMEREAEG